MNPLWLSSADNRKLSLTIKSLVAAFLPVLKNLFDIEIVGGEVDRVIDALFTLFSLSVASYGYIRSKKILSTK